MRLFAIRRGRLRGDRPEFAAARGARFGADSVCGGRPLAPLTTFKVGGPAEWFLETASADEVLDALTLAAGGGVPVTLLGGGSNVLIGDAGVKGLVLRPRGGQILQLDTGRIRADAPATIN